MSRVEADLGSVELASKDSGLHLRLSSCATFAASEEDDVDRVRTVLTSRSLNVFSDPPLWMTWAPDFQLRLELHASHLLHAESRAAVIETLCARLKNAELWQQLSLTASSIQHQQSIRDVQLITIQLAPNTSSTHPATPKLHKLGLDVPHLDVHPPEGVHHITMESVHLTLEFKRNRRRKRRKMAARGDMPPNVHGTTPSSSQLAIPGARLERKAISCYPSDEVEAPPHLATWNDWIVYDDGELREPMDDIMLLTSDYMEDECGGEFDSSSSAVPTNDPAMHLVDAAIRVAITESPRALGNGVAVTALQSFRQLSEVAPSLWSPGFLSNVATRAVFIPSVRCALGAVCSKSKGGLFKHRMSAKGPNVSPDTPSVLLWRMLTNSSYRPHSAKKLKPLYNRIEDKADKPDLTYELLDSSQESWTDMAYGVELIEDFEFMEDQEDEDDILEFYDLEDDDMAECHERAEDCLLDGGTCWDGDDCLLEDDDLWDAENHLINDENIWS